jgi:hypothetical protein
MSTRGAALELLIAHRRARLALLEADFSALATHTGTLLVVLLFLDEILRRLWSLSSHADFLRAVLRCGDGGAMLLLALLTVSQLAACVALVVPHIHLRLGTMLPSVALGATAFAELLVYSGFLDFEILLRVLVVEACLALLALTRRDAEARALAVGVPLSGRALAAEAAVRKTCTWARSALVGPPLATILLLRATCVHRFWASVGAQREMQRNSFALVTALCALVCMAAGQDRSPSVYPRERVCDALWHLCFRLRVRLLGRPVDAKKFI